MTYKDDCIDSSIKEIPNLFSWCYPGQFRVLARVQWGDFYSVMRNEGFNIQPIIQTNISSAADVDRDLGVAASIVADISSSVKVINQFVSAPSIVSDIGDIASNQEQQFKSDSAEIHFYFSSGIYRDRPFAVAPFITLSLGAGIAASNLFGSSPAIVSDINSDAQQFNSFTSTSNISWVSGDAYIGIINKFVSNPVIQIIFNNPDTDNFRTFSSNAEIGFDVICDGPNINRFYSFAADIDFIIDADIDQQPEWHFSCSPVIQTDISSDLFVINKYTSDANIDFIIDDADIDQQPEWHFSCSPVIQTDISSDLFVINKYTSDANIVSAISDPVIDQEFWIIFSSQADIVSTISDPIIIKEEEAVGIKIAIPASLIDEDLTDFPVYLNISDNSGISGLDLSEFFTELKYPADDDFTGADDDPLNIIKWGDPFTLHSTTNFGADIQNNMAHFYFTGVSGAGGDGVNVNSNFMLTGDFDIQIDFSNLVHLFHNAAGFELEVHFGPDPGDDHVLIKCQYFGAVNWLLRYHDEGNTYDTTPARTNDYGKMKITRTGSTVYLWYADGSGDFVSGGSRDMNSDDCFLRLGGYDWNSGAELSIDFDNFVINSGTVVWPAGHPNRKKIAIKTDDQETQCYVEIDHEDIANDKMGIHFKAPFISSSIDTAFFLYSLPVDNTDFVGDIGETPAQNVWDSDFVAVHHMGQDPDGDVTDAIKDSTLNGNDGTPRGSMTSADLIDGLVGKALDFDGSNDCVSIPTAPNLKFGVGDFTIESVFNISDSGTNPLVSYGDRGNNQGWTAYIGNNGHAKVIIDDDTVQVVVEDALNHADGIFHTFAAVMNRASDAILYVDGFETIAKDISTAFRTLDTTDHPDIEIGRLWYLSAYSYYTLGKYDEVRLSKIARSESWIKATYHTLNDDLLLIETPYLSGFSNRIEITIDNTKIDEDLTDFPVYLDISDNSGISGLDLSAFFTELESSSNRKKIAVTTSDGVSQCYVEIDYEDIANDKMGIHFKAPFITSALDAKFFLYYDITASDNTDFVGDTGSVVAKLVWDSDFFAVYHLSQDITGGPDAIKDSTGNEKHLTNTVMGIEDWVDAQPGKGIDFDGLDDGVNRANVTGLPINIFTMEVAGIADTTGLNSAFFFGQWTSDFNFCSIYLNAGYITYNQNGGYIFGGTQQVTNAVFFHGAIQQPALDDHNLFTNGGNKTTNTSNWAWPTSMDRISIGYLADDTPYFMGGNVSEARISSVARSDSWIKATYYTLHDSLITFNDALTFASTASIDTNITDPVFDIEEMPFDWDGFEGDDYDGDDYALPNSEVWEIMGTDSGSPPDYGVFTLNNRMRCDLIGSPTSTLYGVQSRFELQARDFDVHVDFYRISTTVETGTLGITFSSGYSYRLSVTNTFTNGYVSQHWNPGYGQSTYAAGCPAIGAFGGLRMKKSGATLTSYYWTGGSWNQAKVWTVAQQTATVLNFVAHVAKVTEVEFDNFEITNGVINPPA
jgi:hypothetical protein